MTDATFRLTLALSLFGFAFALRPPENDGYLPYDEFASRYGLRHAHDAAAMRERFEGPGVDLTVAIGARSVVLNGATRRFEAPAILRDGVLHLSPDVMGWLDELEPAPVETGDAPPTVVVRPRPLKGLRLVVDPGHGGVHTGWCGLQGLVEKDVALDVSRRLAERLRGMGAEVVMTRSHDMQFAEGQKEDLRQRTAFANRQGADAFVSIHCNGADSAAARGFEVWIEESAADAARKTKSTQLAESIRRAMRGATPSPDRGVKEKDFYVIHNTTCPAVLVELDFLSNAESATLLRSEAHREKLADAIVGGIAAWRGR